MKDDVLQLETCEDDEHFLLVSTLTAVTDFIYYWTIHMLKFTAIVRTLEKAKWDLGFRPTITEQNFPAENLLIWFETESLELVSLELGFKKSNNWWTQNYI